jgi:coilin
MRNLKKKSNQDNDVEAEEEILPVIVRPGHIQFEPINNEHESQGTEGTTPALHWNGITNKRQGQNWGKERNYLRKVEGLLVPKKRNIFLTQWGGKDL